MVSSLTQFDEGEATGDASTVPLRSPAGFSRQWLWLIAALAIAAMAAVPLVAIAVNAPVAGLRGLERLADAVLWRYIGNTLLLMAATGALASLMGVGAAWFVSACTFPARRFLSWALVLPLAVPSYIAAYVYADLLDFSGPVQSALRAATGWGVGDYSFPAIRSL